MDWASLGPAAIGVAVFVAGFVVGARITLAWGRLVVDWFRSQPRDDETPAP